MMMFEKSIPIVSTKLQTELRKVLFELWRKHDNWGNFDEGDLLEIYIEVIKVIARNKDLIK